MQGGQSLAVEPLLDSGNALVVDIDVTDEVRNFSAIRVIALVLVQKTDAWQALTVNLALLLRRDVTPQPDKAALRGKPLAQFGAIEVRQARREPFDRVVDIDETAGLGVERRHAHVGCQDDAVAIENIRPRRCNGVARYHAMRGMAVRGEREHHEPRGNDRIDGGEGNDRQSDPRPRLGMTVHSGAVENPADQPLPLPLTPWPP